ncbi:unannotated protein [freshwater metagenome]|uniref:Unannotated protein n=1 Tax=freshwater metagenome TaxID=449393 RepID=A0A6J6MY67_9ZZZZ
MLTPITVAITVAISAIESDVRAPNTKRRKISRPVRGSTPNQCCVEIPPNEPIGIAPISASRVSGWNASGVECNIRGKIGAITPINKNIKTKKLEIQAVRSDFKCDQAIAAGDRPVIGAASISFKAGITLAFS